VTNASPEPFSNIGLSLLEDAAVIGGLALIHFNPLLALGIVVLVVAIILYFMPKIVRAVRVRLWLIWKKLNGPADHQSAAALPTTLPSRYSSAFAKENLLGETIAWAVPCIAKKVRGVPANSSGVLAATNEDSGKLLFFSSKGWRARVQIIPVQDCVAEREPKFLSENLSIVPHGKVWSYLFLFERGRGTRVQQIVDFLNSHQLAANPSAPEPVSAA
jgi:hypothetical protein